MVQSSGPPLRAVIDREGRYFGRSSYAMLAKKELDLDALCVYLNSRLIDFYLNKIFTPMVPQGQSGSYLRILDLKNIPIPPSLSLEHPSACRDRVLELEMLLQSGAGRRHVRVMELLEQLEQWVFDQIGFDENDLHHMEKLHF